jgi:aryl-alcohol dehydrogenase-like predicted oxidoreductase
MTYNALGRTGMRVSALSLGASSLGGMFDAVEDEDEAVDVVVRALKGGINLIDTAPWYQKSERILGLALRNVPREAFYINTKVGRYPLSTNSSDGGDDGGGEEEDRMFDFRAQTVIKSVYNSLATLGVSYLDGVHVHDPEFCPDLNIILHETLPALVKLKKEGLVRHIGLAGYPLSVLTRLVQESPVPLDTCLSYCHYTLLDTGLVQSGFLALLEQKGIGLINASPFAMGLLTQKGPPAWHPATDTQKQTCRRAAEYCAAQSHAQKQAVNLARLALRFTLSEPRIPTTLLSTASVAELTENLRNYHAPLTKAEEKVMQHMRKEFFAPLKEGGKVGWEGMEVNAYWASVGKRHVLKTVYGQQGPALLNGRGGAATAAARRKRQRS